MQARLVPIGNSYGVRLPKSLIKQFNLDERGIEIQVRKEGILIIPIADVPALEEWDKLFKLAKKNGFDPSKDENDFSDWDITLNDGNDEL
ncbi:MAG TPA: AbrB/MazE/SpoVT family DNA-binding domain-containing protein [Puia sp.]|jgi:antitoxin MazE